MTTLSAVETGYCFRMSPERAASLKTEAIDQGLTVPALLERKVFGAIAPRQRNGSYTDRRPRKELERPAFIIPMSQDQLDELRGGAGDLGLSIQAFLELKVFGAIAPRQRKRRDASPNQDTLGFDFGPSVERTGHAA